MVEAASGNGAAAPLDAERLQAALRAGFPAVGPGHGAGPGPGAGPRPGAGPGPGAGTMWTDVRIASVTASTNTDVLRRAAAGAPEGLVLAAESQTAGKGRLGRTWRTRPGAALTFSVLLRPVTVPPASRGWLPLLAGVAVVSALAEVTGLDARLKWPNDVLAGDGKLAGILAEQSGDAIVVGIGINVLGSEADLPVPTATSLERCGHPGTDRTALLAAILRQLEHWYLRWRESGPGDAESSGLRKEYLTLSATVGERVRVQLPGDRVLTGVATGVDRAGQLLIEQDPGEPRVDPGIDPVSQGRSPDPLHGAEVVAAGASAAAAALVAVSAGDVVHLRAAEPGRS